MKRKSVLMKLILLVIIVVIAAILGYSAGNFLITGLF